MWKIGYCAVTADILHIGHIRYIKQCAGMCDYLIVGVMTDECVREYKGELPIMSYEERAEVVENIKGVDRVIPQDTFEFPVEKLKEMFGVKCIFDSTTHWRKGAHCYMTYTKGISSTIIKQRITGRHECKEFLS